MTKIDEAVETRDPRTTNEVLLELAPKLARQLPLNRNSTDALLEVELSEKEWCIVLGTMVAINNHYASVLGGEMMSPETLREAVNTPKTLN